ncbi:MAG: molybdate ABC transporter substrate-binding protein [Dehalococcoidia bacterium]
MRVSPLRPAVGLILAMAIAAGCATESSPAGAAGAPTGEIVVSAASSLTDAFDEVKAAYEREHTAVTVRMNYGSSSALAVQVNEGAPVDVFASADEAQMQVVVEAGNAQPSVEFASNTLVVAYPADGTALASFEDIAEPGVRLVVAAETVPVGNYARAAVRAAGADGRYGPDFESRVIANVRSEEPNVRAVLAKVELGEADAAIVYATDVAATDGRALAVEVPAEFTPPAAYVIAVTELSTSPDVAQDFVDYVTSGDGQAILAGHGFTPPTS